MRKYASVGRGVSAAKQRRVQTSTSAAQVQRRGAQRRHGIGISVVQSTRSGRGLSSLSKPCIEFATPEQEGERRRLKSVTIVGSWPRLHTVVQDSSYWRG